MITDEKESWAAEIADHVKKQFGIAVNQATPIHKGWLNVKWKMETDQAPIFVKFYHPDRYKLHLHPEKRTAIERTLELQNGLNLSGVRCPGVYPHHDRFIQETSTGLHYAVLEWVEGDPKPAGCLNEAEMFELGQHTGKMHKWLQSARPLDKPAWQPDKEGYLREWRKIGIKRWKRGMRLSWNGKDVRCNSLNRSIFRFSMHVLSAGCIGICGSTTFW